MGFIDTTTISEIPVFYNVVHAVGDMCPNQPPDVKLVQYLLKIFYENKAVQARFSKPKGDMTVDGHCGPTTMNWIVKFQVDMSSFKPGQGAVDGRIDRVRNKDGAGSISKILYTLLDLNFHAREYEPFRWAMAPTFVPILNPANVPPPSADIIRPKPVPQYGGV